MSWNYRIVKTKMLDGDVRFAIHEHHPDDGKGSWTYQPMTPEFFAPKEDTGKKQSAVRALRWQLEKMMLALEEPIIKGGKEGYDGGEEDNKVADLGAKEALIERLWGVDIITNAQRGAALAYLAENE